MNKYLLTTRNSVAMFLAMSLIGGILAFAALQLSSSLKGEEILGTTNVRSTMSLLTWCVIIGAILGVILVRKWLHYKGSFWLCIFGIILGGLLALWFLRVLYKTDTGLLLIYLASPLLGNAGYAIPIKQRKTLETTAEQIPAVSWEHATFRVRLAAFTVDFALILLLSYGTNYLALDPEARHTEAGILFVLFWLILIGGLYFWLLTALKGQTLGKMLFGISVVDSQGKKPGLGYSALRELGGRLVSMAIFYLGFLWIGFDPQKQGLHDKIAQTYVVETRARAKTSSFWFLLIALGAIGGIAGLVLLWRKNRRDAWALFTDGLFTSAVYYFLIMMMYPAFRL